MEDMGGQILARLRKTCGVPFLSLAIPPGSIPREDGFSPCYYLESATTKLAVASPITDFDSFSGTESSLSPNRYEAEKPISVGNNGSECLWTT